MKHGPVLDHDQHGVSIAHFDFLAHWDRTQSSVPVHENAVEAVRGGGEGGLGGRAGAADGVDGGGPGAEVGGLLETVGAAGGGVPLEPGAVSGEGDGEFEGFGGLFGIGAEDVFGGVVGAVVVA